MTEAYSWSLLLLALASLNGCTTAATLKLPASDGTFPTVKVQVTDLDQNGNTKNTWNFDDYCCDLNGAFQPGDQLFISATGEDDDGGVQNVEGWGGLDNFCCDNGDGTITCNPQLLGGPTTQNQDNATHAVGDDVPKTRDILFTVNLARNLCSGPVKTMTAFFFAKVRNYYGLGAMSKTLRLSF